MVTPQLNHFSRNIPEGVPDNITQFWKEMDDLVDFVNACRTDIDALNIRVTALESGLGSLQGQVNDQTTSSSIQETSITTINGKLTALATRVHALDGKNR